MSHTEENAFACNTSNKTFTQNKNLEMHEMTHTGPRRIHEAKKYIKGFVIVALIKITQPFLSSTHHNGHFNTSKGNHFSGIFANVDKDMCWHKLHSHISHLSPFRMHTFCMNDTGILSTNLNCYTTGQSKHSPNLTIWRIRFL